MLNNTRRLLRKLLQLSNVFLAILLLISAYSWLFPPDSWWLFAALGLLFPIFIVIALCLTLISLLLRNRSGWAILLALLLCVPAMLRFLPMHTGKQFVQSKSPESIRVLSWNVGLMSFGARDTVEAIAQNIQILDAIRTSDADVLCLQEFLTSEIPDGHYNFMDSIKRTMQYPYRYFCIDRSNINGFFTSGTLIMSRYPITDTGRTAFAPPFGGSVAHATIDVNGQPVDIFTTRLQSLNFNKNEYAIFDKLKSADVKALDGSKSLFKKIKYGYQNRKEQIDITYALIHQPQRPVIFAGDLNDVPNSYAYHTLKKQFSDVWLKQGSGLGRTFRKIAPTLRIDYLFINPWLESVQIKRIQTTGSDHYGLLADVVIKQKAP
ncbi:MAG TPA: endonuclease/exonuclease/phosphatase family protein [Ferruginibacter sp.]|nr:endonuclease/exonuclease/phosphatase family protein [Ferruginibacter sp.]HRN79359.1 endonuclease/exonuclease/phosphatase family protein [Ferruginibacter sp.]HRO17299.1 endonuclease/exonuclease/phosphatase family protein [Ferruginibacter sp.]HRQ20588.1 endonuclease/exonuclease/phosphatase family protein [Ferruginibacter sp.]